MAIQRTPTTITLLPEVQKSARQLADECGTNFSAVVEGCLTLWLHQNHKPVPEKALRRARGILPQVPTEATRAA